MADTAPLTQDQLNTRRKAAVAFLAYAYMMAVYRDSPTAGGLHDQFVRWYLANRSLYEGADAGLMALESARGIRLSSQLGYNQMSGYALGIALASMSDAFINVWRDGHPDNARQLPAWMDARGFAQAAATIPGIATLDSRMRSSLDPVRAPVMAGQLVAEFINTGVIPQVETPSIPAVLPNEINEYPKGSSTSAVPVTSSMAVDPIAPLETTSSSQMWLGVAGVGVAGLALYFLVKKVAA